MLIFQSQHLNNYEVTQLQLLTEGEFNERTLQKLVTKLSSTFEHYKPDKAIMQYLNQHARQLGLDRPSFASPKEKQNDSNKIENQKSPPSDRKKNGTDRSNKKRKRTDASDFKTKSREKSDDKKDKGKGPFGKHCRNPVCKPHTKSVVSKMIIHLRCNRSTLTWAKHPEKVRITNPRVISNHQHPHRLLITMIADVTFVMIRIIWQTPAHKRESINRMLNKSFIKIKAF